MTIRHARSVTREEVLQAIGRLEAELIDLEIGAGVATRESVHFGGSHTPR